MSAMHWEARRRQNMLDRRMATKAKQCLTGDRQKQGTIEEGPRETNLTSSVSAVNTEPLASLLDLTDSQPNKPTFYLFEPLTLDKRIICQRQPMTEQYSAKTENRYTSTQYSQQW